MSGTVWHVAQPATLLSNSISDVVMNLSNLNRDTRKTPYVVYDRST